MNVTCEHEILCITALPQFIWSQRPFFTDDDWWTPLLIEHSLRILACKANSQLLSTETAWYCSIPSFYYSLLSPCLLVIILGCKLPDIPTLTFLFLVFTWLAWAPPHDPPAPPSRQQALSHHSRPENIIFLFSLKISSNLWPELYLVPSSVP